jgi:hypothetical protein
MTYVGIANFSFHHGDFTKQYVGFEPKTQKFIKNQNYFTHIQK